MARRSTRLSSRNASTPKRVSLSHDAPKTPKTAPVKLGSLPENDEMPGAFPQSTSPSERQTPSAAPKQSVKVPVHFDDSTPKQGTSPKPTSDEMHPAHHHHSTAKPLDEARWLGFANMAPHTEPPKQSSKIATLQGTPTRTSNVQANVASPQYQFTFQREHSLELSPEAKKLMFEKREEAARIREQMMASGEAREAIDAAVARKIATPKGKSGRFSQAHLDQFQKMNSIAGHASAFRANRSWKKASPVEQDNHKKVLTPAAKSLKRSPSKARLDEPDHASASTMTRSPSKAALSVAGSSLPRARSFKDLHAAGDLPSSSPAKRVKRFQGDDATITRPSSSEGDTRQPGTPSPIKHQPTYPDLTSHASPTQSSLARAASVKSTKSTKIPGPLAHSPSKSRLVDAQPGTAGPSTPLLARSPSKVGMTAQTAHAEAKLETPSKTASPLLGRTPVKGALFKKQTSANGEKTGHSEEQLLSRSPMKMSITMENGKSKSEAAESHQPEKDPLLSRSPMKMSVTKTADTTGEKEQTQVEKIKNPPLYSRSPMKMSVTKLPEIEAKSPNASGTAPSTSTAQAKQKASLDAGASAATPTKTSNKSLMDRFTFLRSSPMKSILRSPQRLYSDDPAKVAAGTHLATPPKKTASEMNKRLAAAPKTAPVRKQVDFTSSTKARYERGQSEATSTPSKETTPTSEAVENTQALPKPIFARYPALPTEDTGLTITPQKRRQTVTPGDFTFRAGPDGIVFGTSPNAPVGSKRPSTIRHVSAEPTLPNPNASTTKKRKFEFENDMVMHEDNAIPAPTTTSKKRKFEFENEQVAEGDAAGATSDKENDDTKKDEDVSDERPAKRVKPSAPSPEKQKMRRPTLGVRPKGDMKGAGAKSAGFAAAKSGAGGGGAKEREKKPATISQARLAALAQPKKRA